MVWLLKCERVKKGTISVLESVDMSIVARMILFLSMSIGPTHDRPDESYLDPPSKVVGRSTIYPVVSTLWLWLETCVRVLCVVDSSLVFWTTSFNQWTVSRTFIKTVHWNRSGIITTLNLRYESENIKSVYWRLTVLINTFPSLHLYLRKKQHKNVVGL